MTKYGELELTEMLPAPDRLSWREADGLRSFELRLLLEPPIRSPTGSTSRPVAAIRSDPLRDRLRPDGAVARSHGTTPHAGEGPVFSLRP